MAADCPGEAAARERVAVVETLLLTVTRSVEKLAVTVETLSQRLNDPLCISRDARSSMRQIGQTKAH